MSRWVALRGQARGAMRSVWAYRFDMVTATMALVLQVWLLSVVWRAVYAGAAEVRGISAAQAVSYAVLAACVQQVLMPWQFSSLLTRVRSGQVGIDLTRPVGLIPQVLAQNAGTFVAQLPIAALGVAWAVAIGALTLPPAAGLVGPWLVSTALGVALALLMNLLVSLAVFWSLEINGYLMLYRLGSGLLSGALIPLWFMPGRLATALDWLPFRAQLFTPMSIYFGQTSGTAAWAAIGAQAAWIAVLGGVLRIVWWRAERKVVVLGG